ncbi:MAG: TrkH family potassium uptake protein [Dehalococcoidales bacterium]|jgi:trk system potassium uptake protein TrkH|nr:TrkH family potassium uptake protein [Dehalococcoidales bacterium]MDD4465749.1 TrkH family potassium uptake protein [Dehalococcoidales bacterium]
MKLKVVLHYLSLIVIGVGIAMLIPLLYSLITGSGGAVAFISSAVFCLMIGGLTRFLTASEKKQKLSIREAILLVAGGWIIASAVGSLPYYLSGAVPSYVDAYFEAMSGFTTTGATIFTSIETQYQGILLWRSITQWLGGMGIIMLFVALFPVLGLGSAHLIEAEMPGSQHGERLTARIRDSAKVLWLIYLGMTIVQYILLRFAGLMPFDAANITLTTMPTGGFAPTDLSIASYNNVWVEAIVTVFMVLAGVNFGLYYFLFFKRQPKRLFKNAEFRVYIAILFLSGTIISLNLLGQMGLSPGEAFRYGTFQIASIMTTTGYASTDFNLWPTFSKAILLVLMVIGGCAGSTGGALKVIRIVVLSKYIYRRLLMVFKPNTVIPIKVEENPLPDNIVSRIISLALLYIVLIAAGFMVMSAIGLEPVTAISSVVACIGNVGPGFGMVGAVENYAFIPFAGKAVLILLMLAGRLEVFTILVLFMPSFWRWR